MSKTIWYLEDNTDQFLTVKEILSIELEEAIEIVHIESFQGLQNRISTDRIPSLLIADNQLPKANFLNEFTSSIELQNAAKECPVIVFSGDVSIEEKAHVNGLYFVEKSIDHQVLLSTCTKLLSS